MKTLIDYIEDNLNKLYSIETFVNTSDIPNLEDKNTRTINFTKEGYSCINAENYHDINKTLLNTTPIKVYLFNKQKYNKCFSNNILEKEIPEDKNILIALFNSSIIKENEIE